MKVLNLYAGIGGNRKLWQDCEVTAVEYQENIADLYQKLYPNDKVIKADAHQFLIENHADFDFIWSSPPCQSHTRMIKSGKNRKPRYPDFTLYEEIHFLQNSFDGFYIVENVVPWYEPIIKPSQKIGRHLFWANFSFEAQEIKQPKNFINLANTKGKELLQEWLGIKYEGNIYYGKNHCPAQILRNCVHPELGLQIYAQIPSLTKKDLKHGKMETARNET